MIVAILLPAAAIVPVSLVGRHLIHRNNQSKLSDLQRLLNDVRERFAHRQTDPRSLVAACNFLIVAQADLDTAERIVNSGRVLETRSVLNEGIAMARATHECLTLNTLFSELQSATAG